MPDHSISVVHVKGDDATKFLHRQLTVDLADVNASNSLPAAYLNAKGRVIANFILISDLDNGYYLAAPSDIANILANRLKMFVLRDKVNVSVNSDISITGIQGTSFSGFCLPEKIYETTCKDDFIFIRMPGKILRYMVLASTSVYEQHVTKLDKMSMLEWVLTDVNSGIPWVLHQTTEQFVAQAVNLDLIGAVNWTKGCYPGQEIVARLHYRGGTNRRMTIAIAELDSAVSPGDLIECTGVAGNQKGIVVNCANDGDRNLLLISVPLKFFDQQNLQLENSTSIQLASDLLPYAIPELN